MATVSQVKAQFEKAKKVAKEFEEINKQYSEASLAKNFRTKVGKQKHDEIFSKWRPLVAAKEQEIGKLISLVGGLSVEEKSKESALMSSLKDFVMRNGGLGQKLQDSSFKVNITDSAGKLDSITIQANSAVDASIMVSKLPHVKSVRSVDGIASHQEPSHSEYAKLFKAKPSGDNPNYKFEFSTPKGAVTIVAKSFSEAKKQFESKHPGVKVTNISNKGKDSAGIKTLGPTKDADPLYQLEMQIRELNKKLNATRKKSEYDAIYKQLVPLVKKFNASSKNNGISVPRTWEEFVKAHKEYAESQKNKPLNVSMHHSLKLPK